jgi:hypothetical protein
MADVQGGCLSNAYWLGPWRPHFDDESWRGSGYSSRPSVCLILWHGVSIIQRLRQNHGHNREVDLLYVSVLCPGLLRLHEKRIFIIIY